MGDSSLSLLRGTLDLLILQALATGMKHGYAVSEWLEATTDGTLLLEEGTLYPALHRLERKGWIESEWGLSDNNRRAKYYRLTAAGRKRLGEEVASWNRLAQAIARSLATTPQEI
jgi:transcriptional regulator